MTNEKTHLLEEQARRGDTVPELPFDWRDWSTYSKQVHCHCALA